MFGSAKFVIAGRRLLRTASSRRSIDTGERPCEKMPEGMELAVELIADRPALHVLGVLIAGPRQISELSAGLPDIGAAVLEDRLEALEKAGLVRRRMHGLPGSTEVYETTDFASEPVLEALARWAREP